MAMSRKNYIEVAKVLREAREMSPQAMLTVDYIADSLAIMFKQDNSNFDMHRFRDATISGPRSTPRRTY